jgi:hypothetical protein
MDNVLKGLFGSGGETGAPERDKVHDFVNRYEQGDPTEGYSPDEAVQYFQQASQHASPEQMDRAVKESVGRLNPNQRKEFAEMMQQRAGGQVQRPMTDQDPNDLDGFMGGLQGMLGGSGGGSGGLGGMLGGLLGGGGGGLGSILGGDDSTRQNRGQSGGGGGGLSDVMGSPVGKAVLAGAAAFAMKELMNKR